VKPGNSVTVTAAGRQANARVRFVSPVLDAQTRLVPVIAILVLWLWVPSTYDAQAFSYVIGSECPMIIGASSVVGKSAAVRKCVEVFIRVRSRQDLRDFVDVYIGSMLFFVYSIHASMRFVTRELYRTVARIAFCACATAETAIIFTLYGKFSQASDAYVESAQDTTFNMLQARRHQCQCKHLANICSLAHPFTLDPPHSSFWTARKSPSLPKKRSQ
jgi:hypothetical protein